MSGHATPKAEDPDVPLNGLHFEDTKHDIKTEDDVKPKSQEAFPPPSSVKPDPSTSTPKSTKSGPQLIDHLPRAEADALRTFEQLESNHYQYGTLGRSREALESMTCDCQYDHGEDAPHMACGSGSSCINRLTQVECLEDDCRCRSFCQNQRFQRKQYADIEIVLTEKKGFGLRAASEIQKDAFIYEYIGDVVSHPSFVKRMRDYAEEGIRHFYFMMLQKDEFIDATKRGGIGRFANHSCSPNCYVAKWTVGKHVRMGIFAKRKIRKDEELTFNYNVDRYGHDAQPCYCGEPNCVGFIGGKTQTDVAAMDDLYLEALGISDEVEMYGLKGSKKKRSKKLDEDYVPVMKPLLEKDIPKVIQAIRQTQSRKVLIKLLTRIKITEDQSALREVMRLRGFSLLCNVLMDFENDIEMRLLVLQCVETWPLLHRNKVEDSKIEEPIQQCAQSEDERLKTLAGKLLDQWASLETAYRIPKRMKAEGEEDVTIQTIYQEVEDDNRPSKRSRLNDFYENDVNHLQHLKPLGFSGYRFMAKVESAATVVEEVSPIKQKTAAQSRQEIADVIAAASRAAAEAQKAAEEAAKLELEKAASTVNNNVRVAKKETVEEREARREKRLLKLVGAVVVKCMSKYQKRMDNDAFKKHAKELTHIIAEKEKKSQTYQSGKLDALSDEKVTKIKKFAKDYITKVIHRLEKSKRHRPSVASTSTPGSSRTPDAGRDPDGDELPEMSVNDALGLDDDDLDGGDPSPASETHGPEPVVAVVDADMDIENSSYVVSNRDVNPKWGSMNTITAKVSEDLFPAF